ncbi:fatty acid CoA ligase family protein [Aeoliella sp. SH292]|uniref:fatty acid CoA ligase family protein n=1 Tax=Aeoliella sp. SH292 TaxID=3454464 RepID=UPI003F988DB1
MEKPRVNVADSLTQQAAERPDSWAVIDAGRSRHASPQERIKLAHGASHPAITYERLHHDADTYAKGLMELGVRPGTRIALLVKPSIEFVTLVFALLRSGATMVLVDSGMGRKNIVRCLAATEPEGFVAIPIGQLLRIAKRKEFPNAKLNVTVGSSILPLGLTLLGLAKLGRNSHATLPHTTADDPAAIVFTSGSTGPPKGVVYRHETFATQLAEIHRMYGLEAGSVDLACFPLFGLFNVALGITTVFPDMDFSRPASADPKKLLAAANDFEVTQSFASPAVWDKLSRHCQQSAEQIPSLRHVYSCGAPVSAEIIQRTLKYIAPGADMHTPYGATECLPVSSIDATEILTETAEKTREGAGVCVGHKVASVEWRVIRITDDPIATIEETEELPQGEIGELIVRGPQVSREYLTPSPRRKSGVSEATTPATDHNHLSKIRDDLTVWHRMGDVGYLDEQGRFWYCGRKSQRVRHRDGDLYTASIEEVVNTFPEVSKSALVGCERDGKIQPVLVVELRKHPGLITKPSDLWDRWCAIEPRLPNMWYGESSFTDFPTVLIHSKLPTDIRHNAKINREQLAEWAAKKLKKQ